MSIFRLVSLFSLFLSFHLASAQVVINEIMAKNESFLADNAGEFDDWIEIYNAGNTAIDLANYIITDGNTSWQILANNAAETTVPSEGFILLWADKDPEQGANHIDFKLSSNGELLLLYMPDGTTIVDQIDFGTQNSNLSYGRILDGAATFQTFTGPTPGGSNNNAGTPTFDAIIESSISQSSDDAEEPVDVSYLTLTDGVIQMVNDWSGDQTIGFRFQDIAIPPGSIIKNAHIQFTTGFAGISTGLSNLDIKGHNVDDAPTFVSEENNISNRATTSAIVNWQAPTWPDGNEAGTKQQTPDLKNIIQEIINRPGWEEDNALAFIFTGTGIRVPFAYDGDPSKAAKLVIEVGLPLSSTPVTNLMINEIAPSGTDHTDENDENDDWIELYNSSNAPISVGGLYLTDTYNNLTKWQINSSASVAPNGFLTIWADKDEEQGSLHAGFNLEGSGEGLALVQIIGNDLVILDSISFPKVNIKNSYGRESDGSSTWVTFGEITPGASNNGAMRGLDPPSISLANGIYTGTQNVSLNHPDNEVTIRYTMNGSEPTSNSLAYSSPININESTSLRATAFRNNYVPSQSSAGSFLFNVGQHLPSLIINTDPKNFFDDEIGIYIEGTNGATGFCSTEPVNWNQDWERPVNLSMINTDGSEAFSVRAGVKIGGGCSRTYGQKSLNVYLRRNTYGDNAIEYPIFEGRDSDEYERLKLRNSGQDYLRTMYRDGLVQSLLWDQVDIDLQAFLPTVLYLNGEFWGIHNIREIFSDEYFKRVHDVDKDELDLIKNPMMDWMEVKVGDVTAYAELFDFIENNDLSNTEHYNTVSDQVDLNEFLNYWISSVYIAKHDWPANNIIVWRKRKNGAKWRWGAMDHDGSTDNGFSSETEASFNTLEYATDEESQSWPNHRNSTLFFRKLLENDDFKNEYIQRTCSFIGLIYEEDRATGMADDFKAQIAPEIQNQLDKWGDENSIGGSLYSWEGWTEDLRDFFVDRPDFMRSFMKDKFDLGNTYELTLNYNSNSGGQVVVNDNLMETPYNFQNLYFKNIPLKVTAIAEENYIFSHWLETGNTNPEIDFIGTSDATLTPIFETLVNTKDLAGAIPFKLYPNPNSGKFILSFDLDNQDTGSINIYDLLGKRIYSATKSSLEKTIEIDLKNQQSGIYWLSVETTKARRMSKLVIKR